MKHVALVMELADFYEHGIARGIVRYAKSRPDWSLHGRGWMFGSLGELSDWRGDGIIARVESDAEADALASLGLPVVDVAGAYAREGFRSVTNDDFLTGFKAARYLESIGFLRVAFLGVTGVGWSQARRAGAARALGLDESALSSFERSLPWWEDASGSGSPGGPVPASAGDGGLEAFLAGLERPAAVFACNDTAGLRAVECCARLGLAVPADIAVLGVDDEDIVCELASPSLSSVALDCRTIGFRAAGLMDVAISGSDAPAGTCVRVPPGEVAERESTMTYATTDPLVARAAAEIRSHAHEGLDVAALLSRVPASRRSLETRFRAATGRTLHEEILLARVARAKRLLAATELTMDAVAEESGFGSLQRFHETFRRLEGATPGAFRDYGKRDARSSRSPGENSTTAFRDSIRPRIEDR